MGAHSATATAKASAAVRFRRMAVSSLLVGGAMLTGAGAASAQPAEVTDFVNGLTEQIEQNAGQLEDATGASNSTGQAALDAAETKIGAPYVWGATGPDAFDCSGLTSWAYKQAGVDIPRTSEQQAAAGTPVDINNLQPGDLVTFYSGASHVGIYAGDGQVLNAPSAGQPVSHAPIDSMPIYNAVRF